MGWPNKKEKELLAVAGNCFVNQYLQADANYVNGRNPHYARDEINWLQVVFPNWYVDKTTTLTELGSGAAITIQAAVEYPIGVYTRINFGGSTSGTIPDGSKLVSDSTTVYIPKDALFYIRYYLEAAGGMPNATLLYSGIGGAECEYSDSAVTNKVLGGIITNTTAGTSYMETAIISLTDCDSAIVFGDSRARGVSDTADAKLSIGNICRTLAENRVADGNFGVGGDSLAKFVASNTMRLDATNYYKNIILELYINDFATAVPSTRSRLLTILSLFPKDKGLFLTTPEPYTTSTDSWATTANQTVTASETRRSDHRNWIKAGGAEGIDGIFDLEAASSSSYESGFWAVPAYTADGIHANAAGNKLPVINKAINTARLKPVGFKRKAIELVYHDMFTFTWASSGAKTLNFDSAATVSCRFTTGGGDVQYGSFSGTVTAGDSITIASPFPQLLDSINWANKGLVSANLDLSIATNLTSLVLNNNSFSVIPVFQNNRRLTQINISTCSIPSGPLPDISNNLLLTNFQFGTNARTGNIPDVQYHTALATLLLNGNATLSGWSGTIFPATLKTITLTNNALPSATVNALLAAAVAAGATNGSIATNGGTNGAPTGQGITDKATLQSRGWTVTTN